MGNYLSGALGTNSAVQTNSMNPYTALDSSLNGQNALIGQLQTQAAGGGPNPAQAQYLQNVQGINQQQANTYAQNRALNPGLAARLAGTQAASQNQQAASTAGIQQAQQQLASQGLLGNTLAQQQQAVNNAGVINANVASSNQQAAEGLAGGALQGGSSVLSSLFSSGSSMAQGGVVGYDSGGTVSQPSYDPLLSAIPSPVQEPSITMPSPPRADFDAFNSKGYGGGGAGGVAALAAFAAHGGELEMPDHLMHVARIYHGHLMHPKAEPKINQVPMKDRFSGGGKVPTMVSPGERYLNPQDAVKVSKGEKSPMNGEKIPGKAEVKGDSYKNDKVFRNLDEGGVVIPRSVLNSDNPEEEARKFVAAALAKHKKSPEGEFHKALKRAAAERKNK